MNTLKTQFADQTDGRGQDLTHDQSQSAPAATPITVTDVELREEFDIGCRTPF